MVELDMALTGHDFRRVSSQIHHYPETAEAWFDEPGGNPIWYLSDGGYSRVVFDLGSGRLFLTSNSLQQVKDRWEVAQPQIQAAQHYLKSEYIRLLGKRPSYWPESIVNSLLECGE